MFDFEKFVEKVTKAWFKVEVRRNRFQDKEELWGYLKSESLQRWLEGSVYELSREDTMKAVKENWQLVCDSVGYFANADEVVEYLRRYDYDSIFQVVVNYVFMGIVATKFLKEMVAS